MNTPAHLIFGAAAFARPGQRQTLAAALLGAALPDLSLYGLAGWALFVQGIAPEVVFRDLYYSPLWQQIFAIDNSFVLWGGALAVAIWARRRWAVALSGAALLHVLFDFLLHHDDARAHFWPLTDWVFQSPVSYWDPAHHGTLVGLAEIAVSLGLCWVLARRFGGWHRLWIAALAVAEAAPIVLWALMLGG